MTSKHELMRHALGVQERWDGRWSKPYRNHFVAGLKDAQAWRELVTEGLASGGHSRGELSDGDPVFYVTDYGQEVALAGITFKRKWGYGKPVNP